MKGSWFLRKCKTFLLMKIQVTQYLLSSTHIDSEQPLIDATRSCSGYGTVEI